MWKSDNKTFRKNLKRDYSVIKKFKKCEYGFIFNF